MSIIDDYLQKIEATERKELERIRAIAKEIIPDAEEGISYGMPTLKYNGKSFLGFDLHKHHIGIYPYGGAEIEMLKDELSKHNYKFSSGAIQVPLTEQIPENLLKKIIQLRIKRINSK